MTNYDVLRGTLSYAFHRNWRCGRTLLSSSNWFINHVLPSSLNSNNYSL
jgi:hypothetical protein